MVKVVERLAQICETLIDWGVYEIPDEVDQLAQTRALPAGMIKAMHNLLTGILDFDRCVESIMKEEPATVGGGRSDNEGPGYPGHPISMD